jgi:hypothetical protein
VPKPETLARRIRKSVRHQIRVGAPSVGLAPNYAAFLADKCVAALVMLRESHDVPDLKRQIELNEEDAPFAKRVLEVLDEKIPPIRADRRGA